MLTMDCSWFGKPILVTGGLWLVGIMNGWADDAPTYGRLDSTTEAASIFYGCQQKRDNSLDCELNLIIVSKRAKPEDLSTRLNQAREEFRRDGTEWSAEYCKWFTDFVDILEGRKTPPKGYDSKAIAEAQKKLRETADSEKKDLLNWEKANVEFCKSKTEDNWLNLVRLEYEKDSRTCIVTAHTFSDRFRYIRDSGAGVWVTQSSPQGPCGIVQLSRFEPERRGKFVFWKYVARATMTNPQGTTLDGKSCKQEQVGEYLYDWRTKEHSLSCEYIDFQW
jgi:hypothetical protein